LRGKKFPVAHITNVSPEPDAETDFQRADTGSAESFAAAEVSDPAFIGTGTTGAEKRAERPFYASMIKSGQNFY
jgi:hypothetical protein